MTLKNDILNELQELNILLPVVGMPDMSLPEAYFKNLEQEIFSEINISKWADSIPKTNVLEIPEGYFEGLSDEILFKIDSGDFLSTLPKQNPYQVSADYFNHLTNHIILNTKEKTALKPLRATRTFYSRMAVAASLFIMLSVSFMMMMQKNTSQSGTTASIENQLSQIPDADIQNYIQEHMYEFEDQITYQTVDESDVDLKKLQKDIENIYFEDLTEEDLKNLM